LSENDEVFDPIPEQEITLTEEEKEIIREDNSDVSTSISSDISFDDMEKSINKRKSLRDEAMSSTRKLKSAQIKEMKTHREVQSETLNTRIDLNF